jgi:hypothetical protein
MVDETSTTVALPLVELVLRSERENLASATGRMMQRVEGDELAGRQLAALIEDGYVAGANASWAFSRPDPIIMFGEIRLTPKGRRAVGDWRLAPEETCSCGSWSC